MKWLSLKYKLESSTRDLKAALTGDCSDELHWLPGPTLPAKQSRPQHQWFHRCFQQATICFHILCLVCVLLDPGRTHAQGECKFIFTSGMCLCLEEGRMEREPPLGFQTQRNMYLPHRYTSTGTLMTWALVYIWLLDSRVQYPTLDNIVFPSGWWCITKIRNDVPNVSRGKNNKSHRLVT